MSSSSSFTIGTEQLSGDQVYCRVFNVLEVPDLNVRFDTCTEEGEKVYVFVKDLATGIHWLAARLKDVDRWMRIRWINTRSSDNSDVEGPVVVTALVSKEDYPDFDFDYDWREDESHIEEEEDRKFQMIRTKPQEYIEEEMKDEEDVMDFVRAFMIVNKKTRDTVVHMPMNCCPAVFSEDVKERVEKALDAARQRRATYRNSCPDGELYMNPEEYLVHFERYWEHLNGPLPVFSADTVKDM